VFSFRNSFTLTLTNMPALKDNRQYAVVADFKDCTGKPTNTITLMGGAGGTITQAISFFCGTGCANSNVCLPFGRPRVPSSCQRGFQQMM
jgi:hypothetical protein